MRQPAVHKHRSEDLPIKSLAKTKDIKPQKRVVFARGDEKDDDIEGDERVRNQILPFVFFKFYGKIIAFMSEILTLCVKKFAKSKKLCAKCDLLTL